MRQGHTSDRRLRGAGFRFEELHALPVDEAARGGGTVNARLRDNWARKVAKRLRCPQCLWAPVTATGNLRDSEYTTLRFRCKQKECGVAFEITNPSTLWK